MFLKESRSGHLVQVLNLTELINPFEARTQVQFQQGEDLPDPEYIRKDTLVFPSGETLPRCWLDSHYRDSEISRP
ncbi:acetyltransferase [Motiliproteus sp. SC1-56]|uniref:acetyltransferase n=1 Tax=Motiliproteus sp. SC1-56 TaxID=2799565 RepID=UPI001A8F3156|nr:acetyltransferase [Motiliproteus sp. SC1-56]